MGLTWLSLKQVLDGSSSFFVPWAPSEPAQRHAATAVIPQTQPVPGKYGTVVPEQAMASTECGRSRTLPPQCSSTPAAHGNVRQGHHLCLFSNRLNKAKHLGTSSRLFCRRSGMDFFVLALHICKSGIFFWPSLPLFLPSAPRLLHVLGATIGPFHQEQNSTFSTPPAPEGSKQQTQQGVTGNSASQGRLEKGGQRCSLRCTFY